MISFRSPMTLTTPSDSPSRPGVFSFTRSSKSSTRCCSSGGTSMNLRIALTCIVMKVAAFSLLASAFASRSFRRALTDSFRVSPSFTCATLSASPRATSTASASSAATVFATSAASVLATATDLAAPTETSSAARCLSASWTARAFLFFKRKAAFCASLARRASVWASSSRSLTAALL